ncbi:hypothetical protein, partial [Enterobacter asburiae]|uniref:hypothetical protein n=1 Tax=Enterobacter asburiae TaxID=61645 RepID=UPI001F48FF14
ERFGHRIIMAVATPAHARRQVIVVRQKRCQSSLPYWLPWTPFEASSHYQYAVDLPVLISQ